MLGQVVAAASKLADMRELIYQRATGMATRNLSIEPSVQSDRAGVAAAAIMVLDELLSPRAVNTMAAGRTAFP